MLPKPKALSTAQIKALLGRDSDSEDNCDEIFEALQILREHLSKNRNIYDFTSMQDGWEHS